MSTAALVKAGRPRQWVKNVLVVAPLLPAGWSQLDGEAFLGVAVAFGVFCLVASAIYMINDVRDVEADRAHPKKRFRPIASGAVAPRTAAVTAVVLLVVAHAIAALWGLRGALWGFTGAEGSWDYDLLVVMAIYTVIQLAYCFGVKHEPVVELACVASGFLLRALAGGTAAGIPLSEWFLMTTAFGSLFMAAGKRYAESRQGELTGRQVRRVVQRYTPTYLRFVWTLSATVVVTAYSLWAFTALSNSSQRWAVVSIVPFVLAIMRYAVDVDRGEAEEPEEIVLHDRVLLVLGLVWVAVLLVAVYL
ncbi:decaprenyl-phosphate phosphoribosyltransferase [Kineococcus xinjiangensis]|uniref:Decaprenyl-phosphate phosphoribosyltransferase n=1 Tax=Kineococcus xinjiangensis TaxID=512762 RepID=A0A2S6IU26_9ACTN|nr:decaprenyl-phosphate phosphoribosyltransferase [Kineococcus xinjiangensis]PPK97757.1 decaprenyl-phosphate phosphoribosyltransferase [Kineococcus xinjiangensis]